MPDEQTNESAPEVETSSESSGSGSEVQSAPANQVGADVYNAILQGMGISDPAAWIEDNVTYKRDGTPVINIPAEPSKTAPKQDVKPKPIVRQRKTPEAGESSKLSAPKEMTLTLSLIHI